MPRARHLSVADALHAVMGLPQAPTKKAPSLVRSNRITQGSGNGGKPATPIKMLYKPQSYQPQQLQPAVQRKKMTTLENRPSPSTPRKQYLPLNIVTTPRTPATIDTLPDSNINTPALSPGFNKFNNTVGYVP